MLGKYFVKMKAPQDLRKSQLSAQQKNDIKLTDKAQRQLTNTNIYSQMQTNPPEVCRIPKCK